MAPRLRFYSLRPSHYCKCAERALAYKRIPVETVDLPYHDRRRLVRETGQDYVPALRYGAKVVTWKEVPRFLEHLRPAPTLFPKGREALAETIDGWGHDVLEERTWRAVLTQVGPLLGPEPERWVFEEMQARSRGPLSLMAQRRPEFEADLMPHLERLDRMLDGRDWLLDAPSIADCGVYGGLWPWLMVHGHVPRRFRRLDGWTARVAAW